MSKQKITDIYGNTQEVECLSCAIQQGIVKAPGGLIAESKHFKAEQDFEIPIPGFIIVVSKRHVTSIDEFTEEEQIDFIKFWVKVRKAMRQALGLDNVYFVQEEDTEHHFHVWLFPRYDWMTEEKFGRKINSVRPIMEYARKNMKTPENLKAVDEATEELREALSKDN